VTLRSTLTDAAVSMFNKLIGRLFARANTRRKQKHADARQNMTKVLRLFRETLRALVVANDTGRNAIDVLDDEVGWHRLLQAKPEVEAMVRDAIPIRFCWQQSVTAPSASTRHDSWRRLRSARLASMTPC
jgi:hypothetical protein